MDPAITGEDEVVVGLSIFDNNGVEHLIEMEFDGEITYHEQDGYPDDPSKRTPEENEHVHQARRCAQYHVKLERGYDTMPPLVDPDRIDAARRAIEALPPEEFQELFGDLHRQMASHNDPAIEKILKIPDDALNETAILYRKNIFIGIDLSQTDIETEAKLLTIKHGIDSGEESMFDRSWSEMSDEEVETWSEFADDLSDLTEKEDISLMEGVFIDGVSDLHMLYPTESGGETLTDPNNPFDRDPDVRLEFAPIDPGPLDEFQEFISYTLRCQVRDCFVRMGLEPPEPLRVLGYGRYEAMERYKKLDMYPPLHDPEADLAGWGIDTEDDDGFLGIF